MNSREAPELLNIIMNFKVRLNKTTENNTPDIEATRR